MRKSRFTDAQIVGILKELDAGTPATDLKIALSQPRGIRIAHRPEFDSPTESSDKAFPVPSVLSGARFCDHVASRTWTQWADSTLSGCSKGANIVMHGRPWC